MHNQFTLMHKDIPCISLTLDENTGAVLKCTVLDTAHAPLGFNNKKAFATWWERRAVPKHQLDVNILTNGAPGTKYMMDNLGLSLIDGYWIKPIDSAYTWKDINLYSNPFAEKGFSFTDKENISPFVPSATTQGELGKRWVIGEDKCRYLIKGNCGDSCRQSLNEAFASKLHLMQKEDHTEYGIIKLPTTLGEGIGCISKNFTSEQLEFIPAYDVTFALPQRNDMSVYQHYIETCVTFGINRQVIQHHMDYMILSDFLLTNTDRHLLNLGILRNAESLRFIKPAPYFDTGNSMFFRGKYSPANIFDVPVMSFYKTELKNLTQVKDRHALNLSRIPDATDIDNLYGVDDYSVVYLDNMKRGYEKKVEMLEAFQKGYSLNPRSNNFYLGRSFNHEPVLNKEPDIDIEK